MEERQKKEPPEVYNLGPIPVYDCQVILRKDPETNILTGVVANYSGIEVTGENEREVLRKIVELYKNELRPYVEKQADIPFVEPREMEPGEFRRVLPVHF